MGIRVDKYLWAVRLFKTRTMAADAIKGGKVKCGGENVKPARLVKEGEVIIVQLADYKKTIKVKALPENRVGAKLVPDFMEDLTPESESNSFERLKEVRFVFRPRGIGRPSKKQRRDIDDWLGNDPA
jgi:ribosome-associated heat shock protein Hsp15